MIVEVIRAFSNYRRGQQLTPSDSTAKAWGRRGLVKAIDEPVMNKAVKSPKRKK